MPTIVQTFQGRVTALWGTASMRGADGKMHVLKLGDLVHRGDVILTSQDGIVKLTPDDAATSAFAAPKITCTFLHGTKEEDLEVPVFELVP